jgi:radical SAM superfamily enzyme YgiQ (UPF0313 family)
VETICLIIPPSVFLLDERVFMTLGVLRVAAVLEKAGYPVEVLDLSGIENFTDVARLHAASSPAQIFGITSTTPQMPAAIRIARELKAARPDARLILGGPHVTLVNAGRRRFEANRRGVEDGHSAGPVDRATRAFMKLTEIFDVLVAGDGEEAIFPAIKDGAPKLIDADEASSPLFLDNARLNELPFPARHLVDVDSYHYTIDGVRALSMIAQLGCPFECGFCGGRESASLRRVRMRTTANVVTEMSGLYSKYGIRGFMLYDDELNVNPRMIQLMDAIAAEQSRLGVEWRLRGFVKSQLFTDAQAAAMVRAGFRWILVGFEAGSPRILTNINKKATMEDNTRCVEIAHRHGLKVKALMSIGHPGESRETIMGTRQWLLDAKPDDFDVAIITTYPGTPYYDRAVPHDGGKNVWVYTYPATGDRLFSYEVDYTEVADYYKGDPDGGYRAYVYTDFLSSEELVALRDQVERDVRRDLRIPFNPSAASVRYEHSMGLPGLPGKILRKSTP